MQIYPCFQWQKLFRLLIYNRHMSPGNEFLGLSYINAHLLIKLRYIEKCFLFWWILFHYIYVSLSRKMLYTIFSQVWFCSLWEECKLCLKMSSLWHIAHVFLFTSSLLLKWDKWSSCKNYQNLRRLCCFQIAQYNWYCYRTPE